MRAVTRPKSGRVGGSGARLFYQLDPITVRIVHEAEEGAAFAHLVRRLLRLDALFGEARERRVEIVDADRNVPVAAAEVVGAAVVVEGQLEHGLLVGDGEEVVRRLLLAAADDVHLAIEREPERLVERAALLRIRDPDHRVQETGAHLWTISSYSG